MLLLGLGVFFCLVLRLVPMLMSMLNIDAQPLYSLLCIVIVHQCTTRMMRMNTQDMEVEEQKQELLAKLKIIAERHGWMYKGQPSVVKLARTISRYACERQIKHLLENARFADDIQRFDSYYREKSEFATLKILDTIKTRLSADGVNAAILTEVPSDIGRYDVVIVQGYPCEVYCKGEEIIRVEVKAGLSVNLEQIERYLWDSSPLILVRVITGHVAKIEPPKLRSYVLFSLKELHAKADRLLSGKFYAIPRATCTVCSDSDCPHNRSRESTGIVTFPDGKFLEDLNLFFQNLSYAAERTASLIIEELKGVALSQNQSKQAVISSPSNR